MAGEPEFDLTDLAALLDGLTEEEVEDLVASLPPGAVEALLAITPAAEDEAPPSPADQARQLDEGYRTRDHLEYLSGRLSSAVKRVEAGESVFIKVSMPPRMGKSHLISIYLVVWLIRKHSDWKIGLLSHSPTLAVSWGRSVRRLVEKHRDILGVSIARDAGAVSEWQTTMGGSVVSRSAPGQSVTGLGFKVLILDDLVKDFAAAHSELQRNALWDHWQANVLTRLEPPSLVVAVGTRWHEDDFLGRLDRLEYEPNPERWERIEFPAIAEQDDVLGRAPGEPLISPLLNETMEEALARWASLKASVGEYQWSALFQQRPSPAKGSIFSLDKVLYWTRNPANATEDGRVELFVPEDHPRGLWIDSWDMAFKGTDTSDYVVGQRWLEIVATKYLLAQTRKRRDFISSLAKVREWSDPDTGPVGTEWVTSRLVEDKANGTAIIASLKKEIQGLVPVNPTDSKVGRARSVTPLFEAGNVRLPYPGDPGNEWVGDLLNEMRTFPNGAHDDQVDAMTQALSRMHGSPLGVSRITVPSGFIPRGIAAAANSDLASKRTRR